MIPPDDEGKKHVLDMSNSPRISSTNEGSSVGADAVVAEADSTSAEVANLPPPYQGMPRIPNPNRWTVAQVCEFIRNIPGCENYAHEFLMQEVDGETLLLIRLEHLVISLSMKLGPALKIVACIDSLRPENEQQNNHD